jgi:quinoprotein glucose dehydrogenase
MSRFRSFGGWLSLIVGLLFIGIGLWLAVGGFRLIALGGSFYYSMAGIALAVAGALLVAERRLGIRLYAGVVLGTVAWTLSETGFAFWGMLPRLLMFFIFGVVILVGWRWMEPRLVPAPANARRDRVSVGAVAAAQLLMAMLVIVGLVPVLFPRTADGTTYSAVIAQQPKGTLAALHGAADGTGADSDWTSYGRTPGGQRYSPLDQITPENLKKLDVAWVYHSGAMPEDLDKAGKREFMFEATPLKVRDKLYTCTPHSDVVAVEPETGKEVWRFNPHADLKGDGFLACRGVSYYARPETGGSCAHRILTATLDAKLYALDADTGARCEDFGRHGEVDLTAGMGLVDPGFYYVTSPPAIVAGKAVVGGWVFDNVKRGEPSGVVRAFDAVTGELAWAFDVGNLGRTTLPPPGESYTRGTPNVWTVMSADEGLGLVYLPTGNETPDFYGGNRLAASEKFASSIIAVDAKTGALRWSFQTTHHDIWDFDLPSQPVLVSINEAPNVPATPAIVVPTKQGHFYVLDRRDGRPLTPIEERPVPQGAVAGDFTSPTQPFQTGLPDLGPPTLTEADMWGLTPMDQLSCRTQFRQLRYEGLYTPPSTQGSISYPGSFGAFEWGSVSVDPRTNRMFANTSWMPMVVTLIPRDRFEAMHAPELGMGGTGRGTPYAMRVLPLISPLAMPCQAPPWGHLTAIDLNTRTIAWRLPIGTSRTNGPLGIPTGVPMPAGVPNMGGSLVTGSGLLFIAATADGTFRAFDSASGKELWHDYLPTSGNATPMTYLGRDGRQYVVIAAGGHTGLSQTYGDALVAYALPNPGVK